MLGAAPYAAEAWRPYLLETSVGVLLLLVSAVLFYAVVIGTLTTRRKLATPIEMPVAEPLDPDVPTPSWLDRWQPWLLGAVGLIVLGYGPFLMQMIREATFWSEGFRVW